MERMWIDVDGEVDGGWMWMGRIPSTSTVLRSRILHLTRFSTAFPHMSLLSAERSLVLEKHPLTLSASEISSLPAPQAAEIRHVRHALQQALSAASAWRQERVSHEFIASPSPHSRTHSPLKLPPPPPPPSPLSLLASALSPADGGEAHTPPAFAWRGVGNGVEGGVLRAAKSVLASLIVLPPDLDGIEAGLCVDSAFVADQVDEAGRECLLLLLGIQLRQGRRVVGTGAILLGRLAKLGLPGLPSSPSLSLSSASPLPSPSRPSPSHKASPPPPTSQPPGSRSASRSSIMGRSSMSKSTSALDKVKAKRKRPRGYGAAKAKAEARYALIPFDSLPAKGFVVVAPAEWDDENMGSPLTELEKAALRASGEGGQAGGESGTSGGNEANAGVKGWKPSVDALGGVQALEASIGACRALLGSPDSLRARARAWFASADTDKDGRLSKAEWIRILSSVALMIGVPFTARTMDAAFASFDTNDDAEVDVDEFEAGLTTLLTYELTLREAAATRAAISQVEELIHDDDALHSLVLSVFHTFDVDGSGSLDESELEPLVEAFTSRARLPSSPTSELFARVISASPLPNPDSVSVMDLFPFIVTLLHFYVDDLRETLP